MIITADKQLAALLPDARRIANQLGLVGSYHLAFSSRGSYVDSDSPDVINLDPLQAKLHSFPLVAVLAHEMRHCQQFVQRKLQPLTDEGNSAFWWWDGSLVEWAVLLSDTEYQALPWEQDADLFSTMYVAANN